MAAESSILVVDSVKKVYTQGIVNRRVTFTLDANFVVEAPAVIGVMGPNGSGKTTLFEIITGSNMPSAGKVLCCGQNIHNIRYSERDRLAIHYHQSYQVRHFRRFKPEFMLESARTEYPIVHLFDEPEFNTQDGYIGFMLDFFRKLRKEGRLVFLCVHPKESFHLDILREICERFIFVSSGRVTEAASYADLVDLNPVREYLGPLID